MTGQRGAVGGFETTATLPRARYGRRHSHPVTSNDSPLCAPGRHLGPGAAFSGWRDQYTPMDLDIGRTGLVVLVVWLTAGTVPGVEFFLAGLLILVVFMYTIRAARRSPPPGRRGNDD